jgi:TRAP-type C4-dicarboxylate transport system substrate-binding protein
VKRLSGGRINIELFAGDVLVPTAEMMSMTGQGMIDGCTFGYGGYWSDKIDVGAIEGAMPLTWRKSYESDWYFYNLGFLDLCREAYAEQNVFYLSPLNADPYEVFLSKPVNNLSDLRKLKIRAVGATADTFAELGVSTEYLTFSEIYTGLATGVIDGEISGGALECLGYKFYEAAPYLMLPRIIEYNICDILINMDIWNSLSDEDKALLEIASWEFNRWTTQTLQGGEIGALAELKTLGLGICSLPEADVAEMTAAASKVWAAQAEKGPRASEAIDILMQWMKDLGYISE